MLWNGKSSNGAAPVQRLLRPRDQHAVNTASSPAVSVGNGPVAIGKAIPKTRVTVPKKKKAAVSASPNTDEGEEYEVEAILKRKPAGPGKWQYLVKWVNYPGEDSWEREENLKACSALLSKFKESTKTGNQASSRAPGKKAGAGKAGGGVKKRAHPAMKPQQSSSPAVPSDEEAEEYVVEKLLKWRGEDESLEYLVKWKDYGDDEATWESAKKFAEMKGLIKDMERREAKRAAAAKANITKPKSAAPPTKKKRRKRVVARL